jgi:GrpB-like predicted nucleotidyltransferase (UPF0157 family)
MSLGLPSGTVHLAPADPAWAAAFAAERERLWAALRGLAAVVEHVGSTAVPGLPAKPILDLLIGRPAGSEVAAYVAALEAAGYRYRGEHGIPGRHYFVRDASDKRRTHHIHLVEHDGELWRSHLAFRDYLRRVPARAAAYAALKQELAERHRNDRAAYTAGKSAFIAETLAFAADAPDV